MSHRIHYRVCHVCGASNEASDELVQQCQHCGKHLAPFYYFDESRAMGLAPQVRSEYEERMRSVLPHREYPPVYGLTAYWETGDSS
jgi:hypothetical protein